MLDKIISYSFYLLFFLTPLFWTSLNYELFEYNKMILTYGITVLIVGTWILKMIQEKSFIFKRTPLDIPLLLFLGANILSTIFSQDKHTSIWGYYSRSNGGLLSIISYLLLYWAFVSNIDKDKVIKLIRFGLISGFIISLWGILEHFGVSPSCVILRGELNASCWVQDVQTRVFATLGQPNWMAAYVTMLIFPALYFLLTAKTRLQHTTYYILLTTYYLALTFTKSGGGFLGFLGGLAVFVGLLILKHKKDIRLIPNIKWLGLALISFLIINLYFGSALTKIQLSSILFKPQVRADVPVTATTIPAPPPSTTQLESGGAETGKIRLIVWQGALEIFKHYPVFGSGVETFAYSYYNFRPASHNLTTEWDFLYNKAHNEYLNYLSTTGIVGFGAYMTIIVYFVFWCTRVLVSKPANEQKMLTIGLLASYISYLVQNFFGFSVVIIALFFYLFPALAFVATDSVKAFKWPKKLYPIPYTLYPILYRRPIYTKIAKGLVIFSILYLLYSIFQIWYADTIFNKGQQASDSGNPGRAYNLLTVASQLNPREPFFRSELSFAAASAAVALEDTDATLSALLKDEAQQNLEEVLKDSPKNVSFWRTAVRTYFELGSLDKIYIDKTIEALDQAIILAPTDPKLYYNKALVLDSLGKKEESIEFFKKAIELKPNYQEALEQLKEATQSGIQ